MKFLDGDPSMKEEYHRMTWFITVSFCHWDHGPCCQQTHHAPARQYLYHTYLGLIHMDDSFEALQSIPKGVSVMSAIAIMQSDLR